MLIATRPNSPKAKIENAMVTTPSALRSGARPDAVSASRTDHNYTLSCGSWGVSTESNDSAPTAAEAGVSAESKTSLP